MHCNTYVHVFEDTVVAEEVIVHPFIPYVSSVLFTQHSQSVVCFYSCDCAVTLRAHLILFFTLNFPNWLLSGWS